MMFTHDADTEADTDANVDRNDAVVCLFVGAQSPAGECFYIFV